MNQAAPEMWLSLKQGDAQAAARLLQAFYADLYQYGVRIAGDQDLVKDSIQEIFAHLWQKRAVLPEVQQVKAYLLKSLRRHLLRALQRERKRHLFAREMDPETDITFSAEDFLIADEAQRARQARLAEAINQLTKRQREAIFLRFYHGLSNAEIAETMGLNPQSLYNLSHEALRTLKKLVLGMAHWLVALAVSQLEQIGHF
jgi:RNA polymerase sigma factor (sigma-70 family)